MRTITAIEPQRKNPQRVNVYIDGEFAFGLARIVAAWLKTGQEISDEKIASLQAEDEREVVYQRALHFLSYRPRSSAEIRKNLEKHKATAALIAETIERLEGNGLVNDETFARLWVENRNQFRPRSRSYLTMELRQKGIDDEITRTILDANVDEETLALEAARKYARRVAGLDRNEFRNKLGGFLARRGFSYAIIAPVIAQLWEEMQSTDDG